MYVPKKGVRLPKNKFVIRFNNIAVQAKEKELLTEFFPAAV